MHTQNAFVGARSTHARPACGISLLASIGLVALVTTACSAHKEGAAAPEVNDFAVGAAAQPEAPSDAAREQAQLQAGPELIEDDREEEEAAPSEPPAQVAPASPMVDASADVLAVESKKSDAGGIGRASGSGAAHAKSGESHRSAKPASRAKSRPAGSPLTLEPSQPTLMPAESSNERYAYLPENEFVHVTEDPLSTFSIDVDTASFANVRRMIRSGQVPPPDAVRVEEFINYFRYQPKDSETRLSREQPVRVESEVGPAPWAPEHQLVRLTMHSFVPPAEQMKARNLVFLLDVSGSMESPDKLPLLRKAFTMLTSQLRAEDYVSIVVYAGASGVVLPPTSGIHPQAIHDALERLSAGGSTNGGAGIELAYALAREHFDRNGINRVILATDGDFNVGTTSEGDLVRMIEKKREEGIELSVLGFGTGNINDRTMEQLADKGNGNYAYIDTLDEARKVLVDEVGATLVTVAKDVKIQVEFNPEQVAQYRLIGYENRKMAHRDFKDDRKDAGEVGAGHTVTALYELTPTSAGTSRPSVEPLRYQANTRLPRASDSAELMHVKVRFKAPKGTRSELMTFPVFDERHEFATTTPDFRFAAAVASYAMVLKNSKYRGIANLRDIESWANDGLKSAGMGREQLAYRQDFVALIRETRRVLDRNN